jgi:hypothetical protein
MVRRNFRLSRLPVLDIGASARRGASPDHAVAFGADATVQPTYAAGNRRGNENRRVVGTRDVHRPRHRGRRADPQYCRSGAKTANIMHTSLDRTPR